ARNSSAIPPAPSERSSVYRPRRGAGLLDCIAADDATGAARCDVARTCRCTNFGQSTVIACSDLHSRVTIKGSARCYLLAPAMVSPGSDRVGPGMQRAH